MEKFYQFLACFLEFLSVIKSKYLNHYLNLKVCLSMFSCIETSVPTMPASIKGKASIQNLFFQLYTRPYPTQWCILPIYVYLCYSGLHWIQYNASIWLWVLGVVGLPKIPVSWVVLHGMVTYCKTLKDIYSVIGLSSYSSSCGKTKRIDSTFSSAFKNCLFRNESGISYFLRICRLDISDA